MIKVTKDFMAIPSNLREDIGDYNHADVKKALIDIYNDKCCYCEQKVEDFEVEHYRPKKAPRGRNPEHNGYPWLRLEWSNLLWSCSTCNAGVGGKHNKFPIKNPKNRIYTCSGNSADKLANSPVLLGEGALLIHPEIDDPESYLTISSSGKLLAIKNNSKGKQTISVCNLNRDRLYLDKRKARIDELCRRMLDGFRKTYKIIDEHNIEKEDWMKLLKTQLNSVFNELKNSRSNKSEFALLHRIFYEEFDVFIGENIYIKEALNSDNIRAIQRAFQAFKNNHLYNHPNCNITNEI